MDTRSAADSAASHSTLIPTAPPTTPGALGARRSQWPVVLGVCSIILGSCGVAMNILGTLPVVFPDLYRSLPGQSEEMVQVMLRFRFVSIVAGIIMGSVSAWLIVGGIRLIQRRSCARTHLRWWSILRVVMVPIAMVFSVYVQQVSMEVMRNDPKLANNPAMMGSFPLIIIVLTLVIGLAWGWAWPAFLLWWFARERIRVEINDWKAAESPSRVD
jgi:hypothetical protein